MKIPPLAIEGVYKQASQMVASVSLSDIATRKAIIAVWIATFTAAALLFQVVVSLRKRISSNNGVDVAVPSIVPIPQPVSIEDEKARIKRVYEEMITQADGISPEKLKLQLAKEFENFKVNFQNQSSNPYFQAVADMEKECAFLSEDFSLPSSMKRDRDSIEKAYEQVLKDLPAFQQAPSHRIWSLIDDFKQQYEDWPLSKTYGSVVQWEEDLKHLQQINLKSVPPTKTGRQDDRGIVIQPDDGNCAFHACRTGLLLLGRKDVPSHEMLRRQTVEWMRENYESHERLKSAMKRSLQDLLATQEQQLNEQKTSLESMLDDPLLIDSAQEIRKNLRALNTKLACLSKDSVENYMSQMSTLNTMANEPELIAISALYQVAIRITPFKDDEVLEGGIFDIVGTDVYASNGWITLVYEQGKDHFNAWPLQDLPTKNGKQERE